MAYELLNTFSLLLFANGVFTFCLSLYVASLPSSKTSQGVIGVLLGAGIWAVADGLRIAATTRAEVLFWNKVTYVGAAVIPPAVVLFVASYTDRDRWVRPRRLGALVVISVLMVGIVFTNQWHGLWRPDEKVMPGTSPPVLSAELGPARIIWALYVLFGIVPLIYFYLIRELRSEPASPLFRRQIGIMLLGLTAPVVTSSLFVFGVTAVDFTPFGFAGFGLALTVAIAQYRALDVVPIARDVVVETVDSGVLVLDDRDRIVDANPQALNVIDAEKEELGGRNATAYFDEYDPIVEALQAFEDKSTTVSVDADGETRHYHADFSSVRDDQGTHLGRVVIFSDITEQVNRQEKLVEQTEMLEEKNERLDQFASLVSHDLRNPLNVAQLRLEQVRESHEAEALDAASDALDRIERMAAQLLTLARTGRELEGVEPFSLQSVVDDAWATVSDDGATLTVEGDLGLIQGKRDLVLELFENLFSNAIEHNDSGITIRVGRLAESESEGFFVEDDGTGIEQPQREQVFEYGYTTDASGTGFGLAVVADVVEAHGWRVDVREGTDGGARFEIRTDGE